MIEVWQITDHPYPWRFSFLVNGKRYLGVGVPNYCHSRHQAICRAHFWRKRIKKMSHAVRNCDCKDGPTRCRNEKYDAYYCKVCRMWLEGKCSDPGCEFCKNRPDEVPDAEELVDN